MKETVLYGWVLAAALWGGMAESHAKNTPGVTSFSNKSPVEINADTLEVFQEESRAIFTGHVVAIQGKVRLKADKMTVHYRKPEEKPAKTAKAKDSGPIKRDAIKKIEVEGGVFLSTPQETASGASGLYDVENNIIYLNDNVVLTRGENTLKGDKLTYNLNTGKSALASGSATQQEDGKGKQRVRALFVPDENKQ